MNRVVYVSVSARSVPNHLRWDVPPQNQGQTIEIAYSHGTQQADEACHGAPYRRETDQSEPVSSPHRVTYYRRA